MRLAFFAAVLAAASATQPPAVHAAFPGPNGRIAYSARATAGANSDVWTIAPEGTGATNLTNTSGAEERYPVFSADGRRIVFVKYEGSQSSVVAMDADGSDPVPIATVTESLAFTYPTWSPNGTQVAVGHGSAIEIYATSGGPPIDTLTAADGGYSSPSWRPTAAAGTTDIAAIRLYANGKRDIVRLTSGGESNVTSTPLDFVEGGQLNWSPDGAKILYRYRSNVADELDVIAVDVSGGQGVVQDPNGTDGTGQDYSPDGGVLVYDEAALGNPQSPIYKANQPGGMPTFVVYGANPSWGRASAGDAVQGTVVDRDALPVAGITVALTGTPDEGGTVALTTTTDADGAYLFDVTPGTYTVTASGDPPSENGGGLSADAEVGGTCPGTVAENACLLGHVSSATVTFVYTPCAATERHPNGKPPTKCPIVFLPGFLGTRIACVEGGGSPAELWPNIPPGPRFGDMTLLEDGDTNAGDPGSCSQTAFPLAGYAGVVATAAGQNIYQSTLDFLDRVAPQRWLAYAYDWRRAVPEALPDLDDTIDTTLEDTGASRVVLMAHSMGGLVARAYIDDPDWADKVARVVTVGTPYWGAAKTHFALLEGDTDTPAGTTLDLVTKARDLQLFARHAFGAFWLYPSAHLGPWLSLAGVEQDAGGVNGWIAALGAAPGLLDAALAGHAQLDGFKTNDVDYEVVVGTGLATVKTINVRHREIVGDRRYLVIGEWADLGYASGDGTVLATSGSQGALDTGVPLGEPVPIHYVCGVGHVGLPGDAGVDDRIERYLLSGEPIEGPEDDCPYTGAQVRVLQVDILQESARIRVAGRGRGGSATTLSIPDAASQGLVGYFNLGDRTTLVLDTRRNVTLELGGSHQPVQVQAIASTGDGTWKSYAGGKKPLTIATDGAVTRSDGKPEKEIKVKGKPPKTKARVKKKRGVYVVRLKARAANGVGATYYRIGTGAIVRYAAPVQVTAAELAELTFASVDAFGNLETWRRARKR